MLKLLLPLYFYFRVAPFPHLTSIKISFLSWFAGTRARELFDLNMPGWGGTCLVLCAALAWGVILCQADALSRFQEFKRLLGILQRHGFRTRFFKLFASSRCRRDAALAAAGQMGHATQAQIYFKSLGYKWYHILPDIIVRNPLSFFHPRFLKTTFLPKSGHKPTSPLVPRTFFQETTIHEQHHH